jgi:two-component system, chemotaxis family, CheB/CheR fusion protein
VRRELLEKYFEQVDGRFVFRKELRRGVIFGRHDLIQDPPISRVDLLASRNTLMYFNAATQRQILANFHYALSDRGVLFLGKSEVLLSRTQLFVPVNLKARVFAKAQDAAEPRLRVVDDDGGGDGAVARTARLGAIEFDAGPMAQIVVDAAGRLAMANAHARTHFDLDARDIGRPLQDLQVSYRPLELRSQIEEAVTKLRPVHLKDVEWDAGPGDPQFFEVHVTPLFAGDGSSVGTSITFSDVTPLRRLREEHESSRREVESAYEELQSTAEELETTNEELQSSNEELETTNEELQSTNEELETMNEELQSSNEELETMNDELVQRTDELADLSSYLGSILAGLEAAVVVLDRELRVQLWSANAAELWGLRADEVQDMNFLNLEIGLPIEDLRDVIRAALDGERREIVVPATDRRGRAIRCNIACAPLEGADGASTGATLLMEAERAG